jgi:hypothetical protein
VSDRLRVLEQLDAELVRVVEASSHAQRALHRRSALRAWPLAGATSRRLLATAAAIALLLAGAAFAAGQLIGTGAPVKPFVGEAVFPNTATSGEGLPIPASVKLLKLASADPRGGLAWGMRVFDTTRGVGCAQVGRLLDSHLGVLGQDGAFADDGRFHTLPLQGGDIDNNGRPCRPIGYVPAVEPLPPSAAVAAPVRRTRSQSPPARPRCSHARLQPS